MKAASTNTYSFSCCKSGDKDLMTFVQGYYILFHLLQCVRFHQKDII